MSPIASTLEIDDTINSRAAAEQQQQQQQQATPGASSTITMNTATPDAQLEEWNQESLAAYLISKGVGASKTAAAAQLSIEAGYTTETENFLLPPKRIYVLHRSGFLSQD